MRRNKLWKQIHLVTDKEIVKEIMVAFFWGEMISPLSFVGAAIVVVGVIGYNLIKIKSTL